MNRQHDSDSGEAHTMRVLSVLVELQAAQSAGIEQDLTRKLECLQGLVDLHKSACNQVAPDLRSIAEKAVLRPSVFDLLEHNFRENTHSNVLEYIWNSARTAWGPATWRAFLDRVAPAEKEHWNDVSDYEVHREYDVRSGADRGRIDLLVKCQTTKRLVGIETKVYAEVGLRENHGTQLDLYAKALAEEFPDYERRYVLLSFIPHEDVPDEWNIGSFEHILGALGVDESGDHIVSEYRRLLIGMRSGATFEDVSSIRARLIAREPLFLTEMQQLKEYLNAITST